MEADDVDGYKIAAGIDGEDEPTVDEIFRGLCLTIDRLQALNDDLRLRKDRALEENDELKELTARLEQSVKGPQSNLHSAAAQPMPRVSTGGSYDQPAPCVDRRQTIGGYDPAPRGKALEAMAEELQKATERASTLQTRNEQFQAEVDKLKAQLSEEEHRRMNVEKQLTIQTLKHTEEAKAYQALYEQYTKGRAAAKQETCTQTDTGLHLDAKSRRLRPLPAPLEALGTESTDTQAPRLLAPGFAGIALKSPGTTPTQPGPALRPFTTVSAAYDGDMGSPLSQTPAIGSGNLLPHGDREHTAPVPSRVSSEHAPPGALVTQPSDVFDVFLTPQNAETPVVQAPAPGTTIAATSPVPSNCSAADSPSSKPTRRHRSFLGMLASLSGRGSGSPMSGVQCPVNERSSSSESPLVQPTSPSRREIDCDQENTPPVSAAPSITKEPRRLTSPEVQSYPVFVPPPQPSSSPTAGSPRSPRSAALSKSEDRLAAALAGAPGSRDAHASATDAITVGPNPEAAATPVHAQLDAKKRGAGALLSADTPQMMPTPSDGAANQQLVQTPRASVALPSCGNGGLGPACGQPAWIAPAAAPAGSQAGDNTEATDRPHTPLPPAPSAPASAGFLQADSCPAQASRSSRRLSLRVNNSSKHKTTMGPPCSRPRRMSLGPNMRPDTAPASPVRNAHAAPALYGAARRPPSTAPASGKMRRMSLPAHCLGIGADGPQGRCSRQTTPRKPLQPWVPSATTPTKGASFGSFASAAPVSGACGDAARCAHSKITFGRAQLPPPPPFKAGKVPTNVVGEPALVEASSLQRHSTAMGRVERSDGWTSADMPVAALREPVTAAHPSYGECSKRGARDAWH